MIEKTLLLRLSDGRSKVEDKYMDALYDMTLYDKIYKGTFLGGNLTAAIHKRTGNGDPNDTQTAL